MGDWVDDMGVGGHHHLHHLRAPTFTEVGEEEAEEPLGPTAVRAEKGEEP